MQIQALSQLHRTNLAVAVPSSRPFLQKTTRLSTSKEVSRRLGAILRPQDVSDLQVAKRVEAEIVPEEESTSQVEILDTEEAQDTQNSGPWRLFSKFCQAVTVGALCLAMVSGL